MLLTKTCQSCQKQFQITDSDLSFYKRINVPEPIDCPLCRENRRLTFRNERSLYLRNCESCKKQMVSIYSPDKTYHIYCQSCWWSDKWDPINVGRDFDFSRPFFEQFDKLLHDSKLISLFAKNNQNSEFINQETDDKNCYMNVGGHYNEDCYYNTYSIYGKNNVDNCWVIKSERLYECIRCENCFASTYLYECENCNECHYSCDLKGCSNCFGCFGLRHKEYYFFNEPLKAEEYKNKVAQYLKSPETRQQALVDAQKHFLKYPHKAVRIVQCESCAGDNLLNCKKVNDCYLLENAEDCKYVYIGLNIKDSMDLSSFGWGEVLYNLASSGELRYVVSVSSTWNLDFSQYCFVCFSGSFLFGCIGLNRKEYCILNKQYTREEYEKLLPRIIEHMKKTGEYGQFFPPVISPFCYNETVAQEYFPLTKEQALNRGYQWKDPDHREYLPSTYNGSYGIDEVSDGITKEILACKECNRNYKIIEPEFRFYKIMHLPIPQKCSKCRHKRRLNLTNPRELWQRKCNKCEVKTMTTYKPDRPEIIYCEKCYLEMVY